MNTTKWTLSKETAEQTINNLKKFRKVDEHIAWIIYNKSWAGKEIEAEYMSNVCDWFVSDLWNSWAVS